MKETATTAKPSSKNYELPRVTPDMRMRRLRAKAPLRAMVRETHLRIEQLIYPFFVVEGKGIRNPVIV